MRPAREATLDEQADDTRQSGVLAELIEVERRVLDAVREAEAEAERAIAEVTALLEARASEHDVEVDTAVRALHTQLETERSAALDEIERRSDEAARRHRDVPEARVLELGALVARRIAEADPELEERLDNERNKLDNERKTVEAEP